MSSIHSGGAAVRQVDPESREEGFAFTASGSEYFRIWIVNLFLSVVTLGIYTAWAKVRRNQYFYANTRLAGGGFEYHAKPLAILKGRAIAGLLIGGYSLAFKLSPVAGFAMVALMWAVMPWLLWKSLQFALYNSSYRGIRFGFGGTAKEAYLYFLVLPLLGVLTLGLLYPFAHQRVKRFQHTSSRFGNAPFSFDAAVGSFYKAYLGLFAVCVAAVAVVAIVLTTSFKADWIAMVVFGPLVLYPFILCAGWVFMTVLQNLVWNHTQLGDHAFRSTMRVTRIAGIYITNLLAIIFTLGLFIPFATVRAMKYRLECTSLIVNGNLDDFVAGQQAQVSAIGDGAADLADFDLAL
ncbi:YjgN family protein [Pseudoduganella sp. SL102]|uniref:YjgN family protein n=1 Tax=Pseudoduganella sp. SL102 TaxID=2995154 RepID=UPI00248C204B|nr:YjgN family protein [Pseudoduganella sp. SL102]WBS02244.1 YjgN family protein [Pseudoduganella sp. SL102]